MLELRNRTPFSTAIVPGLDREGSDFATLVIKGTFDLSGASSSVERPLPLAEEQLPLTWADEFHGEPGESSLRYESETGPAKGGTDVALVGHAYARRGRAPSVDVSLSVGRLSKRLRVFGDRRWVRTLGRRRMTRPEPFERMPLVYERAFGGSDTSHRKPGKHDWEERNPVGTGFTTAGKGGHFDDLTLPNVEDASVLIRRPKDRPRPAGFGFIARHWEPRKSFAGTYDEGWQAERCPLLPLDFDPRYFRSAHPDLCSPTHFAGGEPVSVRNASPRGELRFELPTRRFEIKARMMGRDEVSQPNMDTVLIEPDLECLTVTWKFDLPCSRKLLLMEYVRIRELGAAQ